MPHYADGTEAKVGDTVHGRLYNTPGVRVGKIISITPGQDVCNAMVAFFELVSIEGDPVDAWRDGANPGAWQGARVLGSGVTMQEKVPRMAVWSDSGGHAAPRYRVVLGENHGTAGAAYAWFECADYCAISELIKHEEQ